MPRNAHPKSQAKPADEKQTFYLLFMGHPTPMYVCDAQTYEILEVNEAAVNSYLYSREEFRKLNLHDVLQANAGTRISADGGKIQQDGHSYKKLQHKRKDMESVEVEAETHMIEFDGRAAALIMVKPAMSTQAVETQSESELELRALFASMQDVVLVIDYNGVYRKVAPTNSELLIKPKSELLGKNLSEFFPAERAEFFLKSIRQVLETRQSTHIEYEISLEYGTIWFAATISPMDENNTLWVVRDVTERKMVNKALQESEGRYRSLFDRMMDGIYRSTHEGKFVDVNPAMVKMFGYSSKEEMLAIDIKTELYFDAEERGTHKLDTGDGETDIYRLRRKDGTEIWVEDRGSYTYDDHGNVIYHEGTLRDVTARKHAEEALHRAKESLERTNQELERVLQREQQLARTDGLTGLYNYRYFFELATREFKAAMRYRRPLSILMFDTDDFKRINDTLGHSAGDKILALIAQATAAQMRSVDVLARYGGDEFIILLPQTSAKQAYPIAERIRNSVADMQMPSDKGMVSVTLSIGIAEIQYEPADESVEFIVQRADKALYAVKQAGRNRAMIYTASLDGEN
ncbi:MAG TPA: diguanylate cyclase [Anaerolineales bacterium]|nr:diguanylate cyclase [Anaerolineales bacterium]